MFKRLLAAFIFAGTSALIVAPVGASADEPAPLNIVCNDGTTSPTCTVCKRGCCSHHGGCR